MTCPYCHARTRVVDSRRYGKAVRRRRSCAACGARILTTETYTHTLTPPRQTAEAENPVALAKPKRRYGPNNPHHGDFEYLRTAFARFTAKYHVSYPAQVTLFDESALQEWCALVAGLRSEAEGHGRKL